MTMLLSVLVSCVYLVGGGGACRRFGVADDDELFIGFEPEFPVQPFDITGDQKDQAVFQTNLGDGFPSERWMGVASGAVIHVVIHPHFRCRNSNLVGHVGFPSVSTARQQPRQRKGAAMITDVSEAGLSILPQGSRVAFEGKELLIPFVSH